MEHSKDKNEKSALDENMISISALSKHGKNPIMTKVVGLDKDGNFYKDGSQCKMSVGRIERKEITPTTFMKGIGKFKQHQAITLGVSSYEKAKVVSQNRLDDARWNAKDGDRPIIARTRKDITAPESPGVMLCDHDKPRSNAVCLDKKALESYTPEVLFGILCEICSELKGCCYGIKYSSSACIYDKDGNEVRGKGAGYHLYLFILNASDRERFLKVLGERLFLAGYGRLEFSRAGTKLWRTLIDLLVGSPEHLIFVACAVCRDGLVQRAPKPEFHDGDLFNSLTLKNLDASECREYDRIKDELEKIGEPVRQEIRETYLKTETERLVKESSGKLTTEQARAVTDTRLKGVLSDADLLYFAHKKGKTVTVAEVLDNTEDYDGKRLADPLEPGYDGGSRSKAMFLANTKGGPSIKSYAHGELVYRFERFITGKVYDFDSLLPDLIKRTRDDCGAPFEKESLDMLRALEKQDKARFMRTRSELKSANSSVLLKELDADVRRRERSVEPRTDGTGPSGQSSSVVLDRCDPGVRALAESISGKLVYMNEQGRTYLEPQSEALSCLVKVLINKYAFNPDTMNWHVYTSYWEECKGLGFDALVTVMLVSATIGKGFTNSYQTGVSALMIKSGALGLPAWSKDLIPFKNGVLSRNNMILKENSPSDTTTWQLPYDYIPGAKCPEFLRWLKRSIEGDEATVQLLRAWMNLLITGRTDLHTFLHLIGAAGTGKSTFERLLAAMVGEVNTAVTSLKQLEENRFETAGFVGKKLVTVTEADKYGGTMSSFKAMTGEDPLRNESKNVQQKDPFIYGGQVLVVSNERTATTDLTDGVERRRITVDFDKKITPEEAENWKERGGEKVILHSELPGIVNWIMALSYNNVTRLISEKPERVKAANLKAERFNNPVVDWMLDELIPDPKSKTQVGVKGRFIEEGAVHYEYNGERLYPSYLTWCEASNRKTVSLQRFSNTLIQNARSHGADAVEKRKTMDGTFVVGLRFRRDGESPWQGRAADSGDDEAFNTVMPEDAVMENAEDEVTIEF